MIRKLSILLGVLTVGAQAETELTKAEQGRVEASQCYATCFDRAAQLSQGDANLAITVESMNRTTGFTADLEANAETMLCEHSLTTVNSIDACSASCRDMEAIYGRVNSWAKSRFIFFANEFKADLMDSGLWTSYKDYLTPEDDGREFDRACSRFVDD